MLSNIFFEEGGRRKEEGDLHHASRPLYPLFVSLFYSPSSFLLPPSSIIVPFSVALELSVIFT
jgi:hypothetical protein